MSHPINDIVFERLHEEGQELGLKGKALEKYVEDGFDALPEPDLDNENMIPRD